MIKLSLYVLSIVFGSFFNLFCDCCSYKDKAQVSSVVPNVTTIENVWIRPSLGPNAAGFATINVDKNKKLIGVEVLSAPISKSIELHTHIKDGDVMRMRAVESFDIKSGFLFNLAPGGEHIMFIDLFRDIQIGDAPVSLRFKFDDGQVVDANAVIRSGQ